MRAATAGVFRSLARAFRSAAVIVILLSTGTAAAFAQCPSVNLSPGCAVVITISPSGALSIQVKSNQPYDGSDDALVGVVNKSGGTVFGISITGNNIFGFDGDGLCTFITCTWPDPTTYEGQCSDGSCNVVLTPATVNNGVVSFTGAGLVDGGSAFFSLEQSPQATKLSSSVTVDPGHGHSCAPPDNRPIQHQGTTGGGLAEDDLTVPVALALETALKASNYIVTLTKRDVNSCPSILDRARTANQSRSNLFVSVHFNAPKSSLPFYKAIFAKFGSLGIYNSHKSSAQQLATFLPTQVASQLGIGDQGPKLDDSVAVLGPSPYTVMPAAVIEVGRLDGPDLLAIKAPGSMAKAAAGIKAAIDQFVNQP